MIVESNGRDCHSPAENLEQLGDAVVVLGLVDKPVEDIVDLLPNVRPQPKELAVDAVQRRLEKVTLSRVLRVEEVEQLQDEFVVDVTLGDRRLEVRRLEKAQKKLVDKLQVGPGHLQGRLVLLGVEFGSVGVRRRWQRAEQVHGELWTK